MIGVFIIDDHALVRSGVRQLIDLEEGIEVLGDGDGSQNTIEAIKAAQPDVAVVDLEMPGIRGADMIDLIHQVSPRTQALVCSMHATYGYVAEALRRGAQGYVLKSSPSELLMEGIRRVSHGDGYIDPALQTEVLRLLQSPDQSIFNEELTMQEIEVLKLTAEGLGNHEIAARTHQSVETVKLRLRRSFRKLGANDRANAVAVAFRRSILQ